MLILVIILASGFLGFWQERGAAAAMDRLLAGVRVTTTAVRDGTPTELLLEEIVPGDLILLKAGALIPGDCRISEARDLFVDEAALTGETYPVEKAIRELPPATPLAGRTNSLFLGTHVVSGTAQALVVHTGPATEFGQVARASTSGPPKPPSSRASGGSAIS